MADQEEDPPVLSDQLGKRKQPSTEVISSFGSFSEFGKSNIGSCVNGDQQTAFLFGTSSSTRVAEPSARSSIPRPTSCCLIEGLSNSLVASTTASGSKSAPPDFNLPRKKRKTKPKPPKTQFTPLTTLSHGSMFSPAKSSGPLNPFSSLSGPIAPNNPPMIQLPVMPFAPFPVMSFGGNASAFQFPQSTASGQPNLGFVCLPLICFQQPNIQAPVGGFGQPTPFCFGYPQPNTGSASPSNSPSGASGSGGSF